MKKILHSFPLIAIFLSLVLIVNGCKSEDEIVTPSEPDLEQETISSRNIMTVTKVLAEANSYAWLYVNGVPSSPSDCPYYFYSSVESAVIVSYSTEPGCTSIGNIRKSGRYLIAYTVNATHDTLSSYLGFNSFRVYKSITDTNYITITGVLNYTSKKTSGTTYNLAATGQIAITTKEGNVKYLYLNSPNGLTGTVNLNSPTVLADDEYLISGNGSFQDANITYATVIPSTAPLKMLGSCGFPVSGTINLNRSGIVTGCDFTPNSSACDAIVTMSRSTFSKTIDISTVNF